MSFSQPTVSALMCFNRRYVMRFVVVALFAYRTRPPYATLANGKFNQVLMRQLQSTVASKRSSSERTEISDKSRRGTSREERDPDRTRSTRLGMQLLPNLRLTAPNGGVICRLRDENVVDVGKLITMGNALDAAVRMSWGSVNNHIPALFAWSRDARGRSGFRLLSS